MSEGMWKFWKSIEKGAMSLAGAKCEGEKTIKITNSSDKRVNCDIGGLHYKEVKTLEPDEDIEHTFTGYSCFHIWCTLTISGDRSGRRARFSLYGGEDDPNFNGGAPRQSNDFVIKNTTIKRNGKTIARY